MTPASVRFGRLATRIVLSTGRSSQLPVLLSCHRRFSTTNPRQEKRYTADHEWIDLPRGTTIGTIGITTHAAHELGDVVYVELPSLSTEFSAGDILGAIESVKSASDIKTPVTGIITAVNSLLEEKPSIINAKPEEGGADGGWVAKIEVTEMGVTEWEGLMTEEEYKASLN
ncbi:hypothetical protein BP6252_14152 [Coleophoma cylindrospora]|uniref:Glycine cleavage system H protein n=1 Tax=Coleophoma cylindrospora TaxID=1849047 RepID=A0A3D8Q3L6_9HELO|nr:hypothetical protein BP6252_14152 [Coleophoma cylindrospora]